MAAVPDRDVYNVIRGKVELPVMPMVATRIVEECENPDVTAADLGRIIGDDIALTGRLLNLANSAAYRRRMPVETVEAAVVRVGFSNIKEMALALSSRALFNEYDQHQRELWEHSMATALASQTLADLAGIKSPAFVVGLMHDMGQLVLANSFPDRFSKTVEAAASGEVSEIEAERSEFAFSHAEVGSYLANSWGIESTVVECILGHHDCTAKSGSTKHVQVLTTIVNLADELVHELGIGMDMYPEPVDDPWIYTSLARSASAKALGLNQAQVENALDIVWNLFDEERGLFE